MVGQNLCKTIMMGVGTTEWGFAVGERDWAQLQIQQQKVGLHNQGAGGVSDGKWLRGNITCEAASG